MTRGELSRTMLLQLIIALRPKQWLKNGLVLAALIFSGNALKLRPLALALAATVLFCCVSSGLYLINDLRDIERDQAHPLKRLRPLVSGTLSVGLAVSVAAILVAGGVLLGLALSLPFGSILLIYALLTLGYSFGLKDVIVLDVFILASGFVLRAMAGAAVLDLVASDWLFICSFLLALFVVLSKRRSELILLGDEKDKHRPVLKYYTEPLLDQMISAVTGATIVCYSLYTLWPRSSPLLRPSELKYSIPFVILALFRYLYLVHLKEEGGAPEQVFLTDKVMILTILGWLTVVFLAIYCP